MTNVTPSELKMLLIEIVLVGIIGLFLLLFTQSGAIDQSYTIKGISNQSKVSNSDVPWSTQLVSDTMGIPLSGGVGDIIVVSSIFLIPLTIMNALTIARLAKDFISQWV